MERLDNFRSILFHDVFAGMHQPVLQRHHLHPDSGVTVCRRGVLRQVQGEVSRLHFTQCADQKCLLCHCHLVDIEGTARKV